MNIANFSTVEDFWALYNHIEVPSKLEPGCDYNMFKRGIKPMWEDPRNKNGGRIMLLIRKAPKGQGGSRLDEVWLEILLCLIGEAFDEESDQVCGAVVNIRPKIDRISIWTADYQQEAAIRKIGYAKLRCLIISFFLRPILIEFHSFSLLIKTNHQRTHQPYIVNLIRSAQRWQHQRISRYVQFVKLLQRSHFVFFFLVYLLSLSLVSFDVKKIILRACSHLYDDDLILIAGRRRLVERA